MITTFIQLNMNIPGIGIFKIFFVTPCIGAKLYDKRTFA